MDVNWSKLQETVWQCCGPWGRRVGHNLEQLNNNNNLEKMKDSCNLKKIADFSTGQKILKNTSKKINE